MLGLDAALADEVAQAMPAQTIAEDGPAGTAPWRFVVMPYVWVLNKRFEIGTPEYMRMATSTFGEALGDWRWGGLVMLEAWKGPYALLVDAQAVRLESRSRSLGLPVRQDIQQLVVKATAAYRMGSEDRYADFYAGARLFYLDSAVTVWPVAAYNDLFRWVDPLVGVRGGMAIGPRWHVELAADASGFGAGSNLTVDVSAHLRYAWRPGRSVALGYRVEDYDFARDGLVYDATIRGPTIGIRYEF